MGYGVFSTRIFFGYAELCECDKIITLAMCRLSRYLRGPPSDIYTHSAHHERLKGLCWNIIPSCALALNRHSFFKCGTPQSISWPRSSSPAYRLQVLRSFYQKIMKVFTKLFIPVSEGSFRWQMSAVLSWILYTYSGCTKNPLGLSSASSSWVPEYISALLIATDN